jgi:hypothetical protein
MGGLMGHLTSLVQAEDDSDLYHYVAITIGKGVPNDHSYHTHIIHLIRKYMILHLFRQMRTSKKEPPGEDWVQQHPQVEELLQISRLQDQKDLLELLVQQLLNEKPEVLRENLRHANPTVRWLSIQVIARRWLPLQRDLLLCLEDKVPEVVQAARQALVRLGRGTDFGPSLTATAVQHRRAVERWQTWLAMQTEASPGSLTTPSGQESAPKVMHRPKASESPERR